MIHLMMVSELFRGGASVRLMFDSESAACDGRRNCPNQAAHLLRFAGGSPLYTQCLYLWISRLHRIMCCNFGGDLNKV